MMDTGLLNQILLAVGMGLAGAIVFSAIGLISGTDETTTIAPLTLLVVLLDEAATRRNKQRRAGFTIDLPPLTRDRSVTNLEVILR